MEQQPTGVSNTETAFEVSTALGRRGRQRADFAIAGRLAFTIRSVAITSTTAVLETIASLRTPTSALAQVLLKRLTC